MSKKKVFITGIAGFIGGQLARRLILNGYEVAGCDDFSSGFKDNVPPGVQFIECDVRDLAHMRSALKDTDVAFHAAALAHDGLSFFSPHEIASNIFAATTSLVSAVVANRVRRLVFCSSMARYGHGQSPFLESQMPAPTSPYGIAKVASEEVIKSMADVHGFEWVICVPHNVIGVGQTYDDPFRNVAAAMINRVLQGRPPIIFGDGEHRRSFSPVQDILGVLEQLINSPKAIGQIVNVGPDNECISMNQLSARILSLTNRDLRPIYLPPRPQEVQEANCSANKARELFNYRPEISLEESLKEMIEWVAKRGVRAFDYRRSVEIENSLTPKVWLDANI